MFAPHPAEKFFIQLFSKKVGGVRGNAPENGISLDSIESLLHFFFVPRAIKEKSERSEASLKYLYIKKFVGVFGFLRIKCVSVLGMGGAVPYDF